MNNYKPLNHNGKCYVLDEQNKKAVCLGDFTDGVWEDCQHYCSWINNLTKEEAAYMFARFANAVPFVVENNEDTEEEPCPHDEHDHGICLCCGKDIHDDLVGQAEARAESQQDR